MKRREERAWRSDVLYSLLRRVLKSWEESLILDRKKSVSGMASFFLPLFVCLTSRRESRDRKRLGKRSIVFHWTLSFLCLWIPFILWEVLCFLDLRLSLFLSFVQRLNHDKVRRETKKMNLVVILCVSDHTLSFLCLHDIECNAFCSIECLSFRDFSL